MCSCRPLLFFWRHLAVHSTKRRYICGQSFRNNYGTTSCGRMNGKKMSWKRKLFSQECGLHNCFPIISFFVNDYIYRKTGANKLCWQDNNLTYIFSKHFILFFCKWPGHICLVVLFLRSFLTSVFSFLVPLLLYLICWLCTPLWGTSERLDSCFCRMLMTW